MKNLNVIILAGGQSTRFVPLRDKLRYKFLGKSLMGIQLEFINVFKPEKIFVVASDSNIEEFKDYQKLNPIIETIIQSGSGMAGAAMTALKKISDHSPVLIINFADFFENSIIEKLPKKIEECFINKRCLMVGLKKETYFPGGYITLDQNGLITKVIEKPGEGNEPSKYVKMVYDFFYSAKIFRDALTTAQTEKDDRYEVALSDLIKNKVQFEMYEYDGRWETIKFPWHVLSVMDFFLEKIKGQQIALDVTIAKNVIIKGNVIIESGTKIFEGAVINGPVYIGKNCIVANNALIRHSMVGDGSVVGYATEVARSYLFGNVWLHKNYVGDSVFENNISLGSNAITGNLRLDEKNIFVEVNKQKTDTNLNKLGAIIGSDVRIGIGAMLLPGIKIGSGSFIGPGVLIGGEVEDNSFIVIKQTLEKKVNRVSMKETSREKFKKQLK